MRTAGRAVAVAAAMGTAGVASSARATGRGARAMAEVTGGPFGALWEDESAAAKEVVSGGAARDSIQLSEDVGESSVGLRLIAPEGVVRLVHLLQLPGGHDVHHLVQRLLAEAEAGAAGVDLDELP